MIQRSQKFLTHSLVFMAYVAITLIFTYPLLLKFGTHILGDGYDGNQFPLTLWWVKKALLDLKSSPFYSDYIFYPFGSSLIFHNVIFLNGLLGIPLQYLFGLTATQNLLNLSTFVLSAYGTFLLVDYFVSDKRAAFIGGFIFSFNPHHLMQGMGFYHILNTQWIPFYILFLFKLSREKKWSNGFWAGLFLLFTGWSSYNYLIFLTIFTGIFFLYLALTDRSLLDRHFIGRFTFCITIFLVGFAPILSQAYQEIRLYGDYVTSGTESTDLLLFFIPSIMHPVFGKIAWELSTKLTGYLSMYTVYVGYSVIILSFLGLLKSPKYHRRIISFWAITGMIFFIFSLGSFLQIDGTKIFSLGNFNFSIPLPYLLFYKLPVLGGARVTARFSAMMMLALAVLTGYACSFVLSKAVSMHRGIFSWGLTIFMFTVVAFEYLTFPYYQLDDQSIPDLYYRISQEPEDVSILQIPMNFKSGNEILTLGSVKLDFYQVAHQKRLIGGYVSRISKQILAYFVQIPILDTLFLLQQGSTVPEKRISRDKQYVEDFIRFFNVKYIIVHNSDRIGRDFFMRADKHSILNKMTEYIQMVFPLEEVESGELLTAYKIIRSSQPASPIHLNFGTERAHFHLAYGWSSDESSEAPLTYNRMNWREAMLLLRFDKLTDYSCSLRIAPFYSILAPEQSLNITLNGKSLEDIQLRSSWNDYQISLPQRYIKPGMNKLRFTYDYTRSLPEILGLRESLPPYVAYDYMTCHALQ